MKEEHFICDLCKKNFNQEDDKETIFVLKFNPQIYEPCCSNQNRELEICEKCMKQIEEFIDKLEVD